MSQHGKRCGTWLALPVGVLLAGPASGQTIADYSRAQGSLLQSAMTQAAARSAGLGASAVAAAALAASGASQAVPRVTLPALQPALRVSGVFASSLGSVAEVVVNATAYLLDAGQGVPGTAWRVESIAIDRVVLSRRDVGAASIDADGARRIFPLPAPR